MRICSLILILERMKVNEMRHYNVETKLDCQSEWHEEILIYLEEVYEYDELDLDEYIQAYEEAERLFMNGEVD